MFVKRFKFKDKKEAINFFSKQFGVDEDGELILNSPDHSIMLLGEISKYDQEGNLIEVVEGCHANLVTRAESDIKDFVVDPATPIFLIQGE